MARLMIPRAMLLAGHGGVTFKRCRHRTHLMWLPQVQLGRVGLHPHQVAVVEHEAMPWIGQELRLIRDDAEPHVAQRGQRDQAVKLAGKTSTEHTRLRASLVMMKWKALSGRYSISELHPAGHGLVDVVGHLCIVTAP